MSNLNYCNIAILKLSSLGDIIHTLPAFNLLRDRYPEARISWIAEGAGAALLENFTGIDEIVTVNLKAPGFSKKLKEVKRIISNYRKKFDLIFDFQGLMKSSLLSHLLKSYVVGFNKKNLREPAARFFYHKKAGLFDENNHVIYKNLHLVNSLQNSGCQTPIQGRSATAADRPNHRIFSPLENLRKKTKFSPSVVQGLPIEYPPLKDSKPGKNLNNFLAENKLESKKFLILNVGGGWETKLLDNRQYINIIEELKLKRKKGNKIVILWGNEKEKAAADKISQKTGAIMSIFFPFSDLIQFIKLSRLIITADTLPLHIADMVGTPSVGIFGPSSPYRNGSLLAASSSIYENLTCRFCYKKKCGTMACTKNINIKNIIQAIEKIDEKCC